MSDYKKRLHAAVTAAILNAEHLPAGTPEARAAYWKVAELEEELATVTPTDTVEGAACRLGAVQAALRAGRPTYAIGSANVYLSDHRLDPTIHAEIKRLRDEARAEELRKLKEPHA